MSTVDNMLNGDEPIVRQIMREEGPLEAAQFVSDFNNACCQMAGFEEIYAYLTTIPGKTFAPIRNLSRMEH